MTYYLHDWFSSHLISIRSKLKILKVHYSNEQKMQKKSSYFTNVESFTKMPALNKVTKINFLVQQNILKKVSHYI